MSKRANYLIKMRTVFTRFCCKNWIGKIPCKTLYVWHTAPITCSTWMPTYRFLQPPGCELVFALGKSRKVVLLALFLLSQKCCNRSLQVYDTHRKQPSRNATIIYQVLITHPPPPPPPKPPLPFHPPHFQHIWHCPLPSSVQWCLYRLYDDKVRA